MNPNSSSSSSVVRRSALYIDSRCDSNPQPLIPCGPRHCIAVTVSRPSGRFVSPSTLSIHGRRRSSGSRLVVVGSVSNDFHSSGQKSSHANRASVASLAEVKSLIRSRQLDNTKLPASGAEMLLPRQWTFPLSVVVIPMR